MKVDIAFTDDGDLELSPPKVDKDGNIVYLTMDGEETLDETAGVEIRDLGKNVGYLAESQVIKNRIQTQNPDWFHHQEIGADLQRIIGMPNRRETAEFAKDLIVNCLTKDGYIGVNDLDVKATPLSPSQILFLITIYLAGYSYVIPVDFDIESGILTEYEVRVN